MIILDYRDNQLKKVAILDKELKVLLSTIQFLDIDFVFNEGNIIYHNFAFVSFVSCRI